MILKELTTKNRVFTFDKKDKIILLRGKPAKVFFRTVDNLFQLEDDLDVNDITRAEPEINNTVFCLCESQNNLFSMSLCDKTDYCLTENPILRTKRSVVIYACLTDNDLSPEKKSQILHFLPDSIFRRPYKPVCCYSFSPSSGFVNDVIAFWLEKELHDADRYSGVSNTIEKFVQNTAPVTLYGHTLAFTKNDVSNDWEYNVFEEEPEKPVKETFDMEDFLTANRLTRMLTEKYLSPDVPPLFLVNRFSRPLEMEPEKIVQKLRELDRQVFILEWQENTDLGKLCDSVIS